MVLLERIPKITSMLGRLLSRLPFREVWLSVAVLMVVGENYPFSNFPMYSNLEEEATYFVVVNARDEIMPYVPNFRSRSSYVPKALKTERRKLEKQGLTSEVALREAGKSVLLSLVKRAEPQKREDLLGKGLKLVEVQISVGSSRLQQEQRVVAEIPPSH
ncbi:MAG TPA: hypothetical protein VIT23_12930 [Terrimicrobiaceae bacterium]